MNDGIGVVLTGAAALIEAQDAHRRHNHYGKGAGPQVYADLFEAAGQRFAWPAIVHLQRHLVRHGYTAASQLQHWSETDPQTVIAVLREAAGMVPDEDTQVAAVRHTLTTLVEQLTDALGWSRCNMESPQTVVREVVTALRRSEQRAERLEAAVRELEAAAAWKAGRDAAASA